MSVLLTHDPDIYAGHDHRLSIDMQGLPPGTIPDIATRLEQAFDAAYAPWREIAHIMQRQSSAELAHMPTMSTYASDFGVMLAWVWVIRDLAQSDKVTCVTCQDPWLYRALSLLDGVTSQTAPGLAAKRLRFFCRGVLARSKAAGRALLALIRTRTHRQCEEQANWILVYGHPDSNADGKDAYFGTLMRDIPGLQRLMHTDCSASYAATLAGDGRTRSLHAWGSIFTACRMPFARWRPDTSELDPVTSWLVRRAAAIEGSGGSAAMTLWQITCQRNWLKGSNPKTVAWPWENHPWERDFVRGARLNGTVTCGYQHTVVGRHMYNQGADANLDGADSIPDTILLNGPAYHDDLTARGIPAERLQIAGSHRIGAGSLPVYDPRGPVFLALSNSSSFARQMIDATRPLAGATLPFIVKDHPLSPYPVTESDHFSHTRAPIAELPAIRALIYCTGTTGLEGLLSGVPTIRFIPDGGVALDILPRGLQPLSVSAADLAGALQNLPEAANHAQTELFPPPDLAVWRRLLDDTHDNRAEVIT